MDGARLDELRKPVLDHIHANFDPDYTVEDETAKLGNITLTLCGVIPLHQGKGVGSQLLQFGSFRKAEFQRPDYGPTCGQAEPKCEKLYLRLVI